MTDTTLVVRHDFNKPRTEAGFYEVVLSRYIESNFHTGDTIILRDYEGEPEIRGRIRCLVAIVEETPDD